MNRIIKRTNMIILVALTLSLIISPMTFASDSTEINTAAQNEAISQITSLITEGYSPYYDILEIKTEITQVEDTKDSLDVYVKASMDSILKANSVAELPHVQGMMKALNLTSLEKDSVENTVKLIKQQNNELNLSDMQVERAAKLLQNKIIDIEPYIKEPAISNFMFKFTIPKSKIGIAPESSKLLYEDYEDYIPATCILPKSNQEMINDGITEVMTAINASTTKNNTLLYSGYDRLDARDYAIANCSWATTYCSHYPSVKCQQDITYWNTYYYPAFLYNFCHNDCADFVSQALHYGGISKTSTWTRAYYTDQSWTYAWQNCNGLRSYMINNGYWSSSNYTNAAAGGIRLWYNTNSNGIRDYYHVGMIVRNDTIIREFNAHTYDRSHYVYSNESNKEYYILW